MVIRREEGSTFCYLLSFKPFFIVFELNGKRNKHELKKVPNFDEPFVVIAIIKK
jgi:hypothetical protein